MEMSNKTARELYEAVKANPNRQRFGFGRKPALVNVDLQCAYTRPAEFVTAYETDPQADRIRERDWRGCSAPTVARWSGPTSPIWTRARIAASGAPAAIRRIRCRTSRRTRAAPQLDDRCEIDRARDIVINKRMASAFFETNLGSLFTFHKVDTVIVTGGSTSGCVRATVVDSLSRSFRTVVPEECVSDKHESPHYANLYDMALKYADVLPVAEVVSFMEQYKPAN